MRRLNKTMWARRTKEILRNNDGTSIVLVTIIAIIIITCVVILRVSTSALWASADKQYNQDQAYMLATSMGKSIDDLITHNKINLADYNNTAIPPVPAPSGIPRSSVEVSITPASNASAGYVVTVNATVADASYVYTAYYTQGKSGTYTRQLV